MKEDTESIALARDVRAPLQRGGPDTGRHREPGLGSSVTSSLLCQTEDSGALKVDAGFELGRYLATQQLELRLGYMIVTYLYCAYKHRAFIRQNRPPGLQKLLAGEDCDEIQR